MISYLLFALLFIISFLLTQIFLINLKAERYRSNTRMRLMTKDNFFKNFISKINFIKTKENFLSKQGNPFNLNVITYYLLKLLMAVVFFVAGIVNYNSQIIGIVFSVVGFILIDLIIISRKNTRDSEICADLMQVTNSICLQLSAGVTLKNSIRGQYENCKNKDLRKALLEFSTMYELSELNITDSTKELNDKFDILEINMFCKALETYNETTKIEEVLESLTEMLKKRSIEKVRKNTATKILYITVGVIVALGNIIMITFYPLFINVGQGFGEIFK